MALDTQTSRKRTRMPFDWQQPCAICGKPLGRDEAAIKLRFRTLYAHISCHRKRTQAKD